MWSNALREHIKRFPDIYKSPFVKGLEGTQNTLHSGCLKRVFEEAPEGSYAYDVFSEIVALYVSTFDPTQLKKQYTNLCENMIQAFSEAYADLRMLELIGDKFTIDDYTDLFFQVDVDNDFQKILRHDAVLSVLKPCEDWEKQVTEDLFLSYVLEQIQEYLRLCHMKPASSTQVSKILEILKGNNITEQFKCIRKTIWTYREKLIKDCKRIQQEYEK